MDPDETKDKNNNGEAIGISRSEARSEAIGLARSEATGEATGGGGGGDPILYGHGTVGVLRYVMMSSPDGQYSDLDSLARTAESLIWPPSDVDLSSDRRDWDGGRVSDSEKRMVEHILAFFAVADGIVAENLVLNLYPTVQIPEARRFYATQLHMETVHAQVYAAFVEALVPDRRDQARVLALAVNHFTTKAKNEWALRWIVPADTDRNLLFSRQMVAFAAVEMVFFSSSFIVPSWLRTRGLMLGFATANDQIRRDEGLHGDFAAALFSHLRVKPSPKTVWQIVTEAVGIEESFACDVVPDDLGSKGMTRDLMVQHVRSMGDFCLRKLGVPHDPTATPHYGVTTPFEFARVMDLPRQTAFFERTPTDYIHRGGGSPLRRSQTGLRASPGHPRPGPTINTNGQTAGLGDPFSHV